MKSYHIRAHPTQYRGVKFRSRLEARWAVFFDLAGWRWEYEPVDLEGWTPDFWVQFYCGHSEDPQGHELYVEVKPYRTVKEFDGHPARKFDPYQKPNPATFGLNPDVTEWEMVHGHGGGLWSVIHWVLDTNKLWVEAGNIVRYNREAEKQSK